MSVLSPASIHRAFKYLYWKEILRLPPEFIKTQQPGNTWDFRVRPKRGQRLIHLMSRCIVARKPYEAFSGTNCIGVITPHHVCGHNVAVADSSMTPAYTLVLA